MSQDNNSQPDDEKPAPKQDAYLKKLIKQSLKNDKQKSTRKIRGHKELEYLGGMVGEFLEAYIILGYDMEGNAINMCSVKNQQHVDGLTTLIHQAAISADHSEME